MWLCREGADRLIWVNRSAIGDVHVSTGAAGGQGEEEEVSRACEPRAAPRWIPAQVSWTAGIHGSGNMAGVLSVRRPRACPLAPSMHPNPHTACVGARLWNSPTYINWCLAFVSDKKIPQNGR